MIGVDEVGRGAWAGPLLVCAVRLSKPINGLKDSKTLTKLQRQRLAKEILDVSDVGYGWLYPKEIDKYGLGKALKIATILAVSKLAKDTEEQIIIDGNVNLAPGYNVSMVVKADNCVPCVSAASIMAKVTRDNYMCDLTKDYPQFQFNKNVGYGTKHHREALKSTGLTPLHRRSFKIKF